MTTPLKPKTKVRRNLETRISFSYRKHQAGSQVMAYKNSFTIKETYN